MALMKSQVATQISGSVGGVTYAHNKSGMYMRARSIPVQPDSAAQLQVRSALTALVNAWINDLTAANRAAWNLYAQNVSVTNPLGDQINNSGQNWYIGCNSVRLQGVAKLSTGLTRIDAGPTTYNRGDFTTPVVVLSVASGVVLSGFSGDDWAAEDDAGMNVFLGAPQDATRNFYKGPFRMIDVALGDSGTPITSNTTTTANAATRGYQLVAGQRVWVAVSVTRADGRLSSRRIIGPTTVTS